MNLLQAAVLLCQSTAVCSALLQLDSVGDCDRGTPSRQPALVHLGSSMTGCSSQVSCDASKGCLTCCRFCRLELFLSLAELGGSSVLVCSHGPDTLPA